MRSARNRSISSPWIPVAGLFLGACGGGGSGGESLPSSLSFATAGTALDEGDSTLAVQVVLHTTLAALTEAVSVTISDRATGSADAGSDYAVFAPEAVSFPVGSIDGDTQTVMLTALDDALVEGPDETVALGLASASGASISTPSTFTLTIRDIHFADIQFVTAASSSLEESAGTFDIVVGLDLPPGVDLGADMTVVVSDAGGGSAASGTDYTAFAPQTVTFESGSLDGATQNVSIDVLDDTTTEIDETVRLALSAPSSGANVGSNSVHELTILDDESGGPAVLVPTEGATGTENPLVDNEVVDLGSQTVGAGGNAGTLVRLENAGAAALHFEAPSLTGSHANDFEIVVESSSIVAPSSVATAGDPALDAASPLVAASNGTGPGVALAFDAPLLSALAPLLHTNLIGVPLPGLGEVTLQLQRMPLPITHDAVLRVDGVAVPGGLQSFVSDLSVWTGNVLEVPGSRVFLTLTNAGPQGFVELPGSLNPLVHLTRGSDGVLRAVDSASLGALGFTPSPFSCVDAPPVPAAALRPQGSNPSAALPGTGSLDAAECRMAIETDYQLYQRFGSTGGVTSYVTQLIAAVSAQYFEDVQTSLSIAYLGVYSSPSDPWTSQDAGGDSLALLNEFVDAWTPSAWPVSANLAHFISGASLGGGIAYVGVLCNSSYGFGVSGNISGNINWGTWNGTPGSFTWDFVVVAHELGHNFGSDHTHSYCPPLDQCYTNCTGPTVCSQGTIMSYCHTCGGMDNIDLHFHPVTANIMRQSVNASCLGESALFGGDWVQYRVRFAPRTATGTRSATLTFAHDAENAPQPFHVLLNGTAQ